MRRGRSLGERASRRAGRPPHRALHKGHTSEGERGRREGGKEEEWVHLSFGEGARREVTRRRVGPRDGGKGSRTGRGWERVG
jgi:hypothetical protein